MRNLGFFLSLCLLSAVSALAAETNRPAAAAPDEASQIAAAEEQPVDILLRRNLSRFGEVKVEGFTAKQDFNVANAIIMTKINRGLNDADLRLCRGLGQGKAADVYVLVYPVGEGNVADIINFLPEGTGDGILSFIYD